MKIEVDSLALINETEKWEFRQGRMYEKMKRVIQFPHRAVEFTCQRCWLDQANHITKWNPADHHWRRLIHCAGRHVDRDQTARNGDLSFGSEWEANTIAEPFPQTLMRQKYRDITAKWVHEVIKPNPRRNIAI